MPFRLDKSAADFEPQFEALLASKREASEDVDSAVAAIIEDVRARGDEALAEYSLRFDRIDLARLGVRVGDNEIGAAIDACDREALAALELAYRRVLTYHQRQKPQDL